MLSYRAFDDATGALRSRCLLVRCLVAAGRSEEAHVQADLAHAQLSSAEPDSVEPLRAMLLWARGLLLAHGAGTLDSGVAHLREARVIASSHGDGQTNTAIEAALRRIPRQRMAD